MWTIVQEQCQITRRGYAQVLGKPWAGHGLDHTSIYIV
jgi:hypothetical protein